MRGLFRSSRVWIPLAVFLTVGSLAGVWMQAAEQQRSQRQRTLVQTLVRSQAWNIERQLDRCLTVPSVLSEMVSRTVTIAQFEALAADMIRRHGGISYIELAPNGAVRQVYPRQLVTPGQPANLTSPVSRVPALPPSLVFEPLDPNASSPVVMVGRLPVFVPVSASPQKFWGVVSVGIHVERLLHSSRIQTLAFDGYDYELSHLDANSQDRRVISRSSPTPLRQPITEAIAIPNGNWLLAISPKDGWEPPTPWVANIIFAMVLSGASSASAAALLRTRQPSAAGFPALAKTISPASTSPVPTSLDSTTEAVFSPLTPAGSPSPAGTPSNATPSSDRVTILEAELATARDSLAIAQLELISAQKFATLGHLSLGIAGDINTHLSTLRAANTHLANTLALVLPELPHLLKPLDLQQQVCFFTLIQSARITRSLDAQQYQAQQHAIVQQLTARSNTLELATYLVDLGITTDLRPVMPLLNAPNVLQLFGLVLALAKLRDQSHSIGVEASEIGKILFALRSFSQPATQSPKVLTYIPTHLDLILTLYAHQLENGIVLHRQYEPLPPILCYPDELSHVWSTLIHNAIQSIEPGGELTIAVSSPPPPLHTRQRQRPLSSPGVAPYAGAASRPSQAVSEDCLIVSITDTGPGTSSPVFPHIQFPLDAQAAAETGYSGVNLDMTRKIVARHRGEITVERRPGNTTVQVWLPIGEPEEQSPQAKQSKDSGKAIEPLLDRND